MLGSFGPLGPFGHSIITGPRGSFVAAAAATHPGPTARSGPKTETLATFLGFMARKSRPPIWRQKHTAPKYRRDRGISIESLRFSQVFPFTTVEKNRVSSSHLHRWIEP